MAPKQAADAAVNRRIWWACIAVIYVGLCFVALPDSKLWTGVFYDSDDYMRLVQVFNWLDGQSWYDLSQPRFAGDDHFILAWSRLVDLPLAGVILLAEPWVGRMPAAGVAAFMVPLLLLGLFCFCAPLLTRGLMPARRGWIGVVAAMGAIQLLREMSPMRVDHHGWQLFIALLNFICLLRYAITPRVTLRILSGAACALGLAVGAESILWTALTAAFVALDAAWRGGVRRNDDAAAFGLALTAGILLLLPVLRLPHEWLAHEMSRLSLPHIVGASLLALGIAATRPLAGCGRGVRLAALLAAGAGALALFLFAIPAARAGIYADMAAGNRDFVVGNVLEAKSYWLRLMPLWREGNSLSTYWPMIAQGLLAPFVGALTALLMLMRARGRRRGLWAAVTMLLVPSVLMGLFWQSRVMIYGQLFALPPIAWLLQAGWRRVELKTAGRRWLAWPGRAAVLASFIVPVMVSSLWGLGARLPQFWLYPAWTAKPQCDLRPLAAALNDPAFTKDGPKNILTVLTGGAELLYRTPHRVYSAPYDLAGNAMARDFLTATDVGEARMLAQMHGIDLVFICDRYVSTYYKDPAARAARESFAYGKKGGLELTPEADAKRIMVDRLTGGDRLPWLVRVPLPKPDMHLFVVRLPSAAPGATTEGMKPATETAP